MDTTSHLVAEMAASSEDMIKIPTLIGDTVVYFHDVDGHYDRENEHHCVELIHRAQGPDTPPKTLESTCIETHMEDAYYYLLVEGVNREGVETYPEDDFRLVLDVIDYQTGPFSFAEELQKPIDRRETEYEWSK